MSNQHNKHGNNANNPAQVEQPATEVTQSTEQPVTEQLSRSAAKEIEREDFLKKIRKVRSLKALLRDSSKDDLLEYAKTFNAVVNDRIAELQEIEDKQAAEIKAAEDTIKELREKGINLDLLKNILNK
ncbi:H-NS family histone-like protein [Photobacterium leiognathi]|uniref:H-NS family histone-like protein n=1 Tax=Photobacterium leiognathi TaxID=553611 RepID=UPI002980AD19|nr:hypothetical protein [Photobacterium leiognathi]